MGEVAEMFDVKTSLIRHWETQFSVLKPKRNKKGNRLFSPEDVENLKVIYHLVKERGMTLEGAKRAMKRRASNGDEIRREAELMTRLKHIRALLVEVREDLKTGAEGIVDEEPVEAEAMRAFDATEEGPIEEAGGFETEEAGDFEEPGRLAEADVQAAEETVVVKDEPHAEESEDFAEPGRVEEADRFAKSEDFAEATERVDESEDFAEATEGIEESEATGWAEEEPLEEESERELQVVEVLDDTDWEEEDRPTGESSWGETTHYAEPENNREAEVHFTEQTEESGWGEAPAAVEPVEAETSWGEAPATVEPAEAETSWGEEEVPESAPLPEEEPAMTEAPTEETQPSAEPGEPKPRTTGRRGRRKSDDDDKELFAFYEQSLF